MESGDYTVLQYPENTASLASENNKALKRIGVSSKAFVRKTFKKALIVSNEGLSFLRFYNLHWATGFLPTWKPLFPLASFSAFQGSFWAWVNEFLRRIVYKIPLHWRFQYLLGSLVNRYRAKQLSFFSDVDIIHCYTGDVAGRAPAAVIKHFHIPGLAAWQGSEARIAEVEQQDNPYFRFLLDRQGRSVNALTLPAVARQRYCCDELGFEPLVTRDMLQYVLPEYREHVHITTHPVEIDHEPAYPDPAKRRPLILHAPSKRDVKGTVFLERALDALRARGIEFDYEYLTGVKHETVLEAMARCDIFCDHFLLGNVCVAALEAMSYGKPTVFYLKESIEALYPPELSFMNANPDNLASRLYLLIKDGELRADLGRRSRAYIERYHAPALVAKGLDGIYRELLSRKQKVGGNGAVIDPREALEAATRSFFAQFRGEATS